MTEWTIDPVPGSYWVIGAAAVLFCLGPAFGSLPPRRKWTLTALRFLALLALLLMLMRPTLVSTLSKKRESIIAVLADLSRSMTLPSGVGEETRWQKQTQALTELVTAAKQLPPEIKVQWYGYGDALESMTVENGVPRLPAEPALPLTDVGSPLDDALRRAAGHRVTAVILLGDGTQTAANPQTDSVTAVRRLRDESAAPLFALPFGPKGTASQGKDVAVERLDDQFTVFVKNELAFSSQLRIAGYANQEIPVELVLSSHEEPERVIAKTKAIARDDDRPVNVNFAFVPEKAGRFKLTVRAPVQPGELVNNNNSLDAFLTVREGGLKILTLDGGKRPEFGRLRRAMNDSPDMELDDLIIDSLSRKDWPKDMGKTLSEPKYDAFILGNVPAEALGNVNLKDLAIAVEKGRGLIVVGGLRTLGAGNYGDSPLAAVLPIEFDRFEKQEYGDADRDDLFLQGPIPLTPTGTHAATRLGSDADNAAIWKKLPPLDFANRITKVKKTPGTRVLLTGPNKEPIMVAGEYGQGRVLVFAGESTWRWVMKGNSAEHKRFWRQIILWLTRREDQQQNDVWVKLDQRRLAPGSLLKFTAGAKSPEGDELVDAKITATLVAPDGTKSDLRTAQSKALHSGSQPVKTPGDYAIEIEATKDGKSLGQTRAEFVVYQRDVELSNPAADHEHFARLANITKAQGGRVISPDELSAVIGEIAARPIEQEIKQVKWRLGEGRPQDGSFDALLLLAALIVPLGIEWWLRKKWGLV